MPSQQSPSDRKRTAILVVHGMGSQRPLDTVRGVVEAIWLEGKNRKRPGKRVWVHPEQRGTDIDLSVITTDSIPRVDFHELYWAHLMSETRAVAVLLWLFELARRGPRLKRSIRSLYWGVLVFLALLVLSVSLLVIQFIFLFVEKIAHISALWHTVRVDSLVRVEFRLLIFVFLVTFVVVTCFITASAVAHGAIRLAVWSALTTACAVLIFVGALLQQTLFEHLTNAFLPLLVALVAVKIAMGWWGVAGLIIAYALSLLALLGFSHSPAVTVCTGLYCFLPWSITAFWSSIAAWVFVAIYLASYSLFLQPYLGDAARYFRNAPGNVAIRREIRKEAVDTLEDLHLSGKYDRIVVAAHSLGTVVAYDMLRAYYSRIDQNLPNPQALGTDIEIIDHQEPNREEARKIGRALVSKIQNCVEAERANNSGAQRDKDIKAWLVTDFVTMGSPLTHAYYLNV